jgi:hypothetical protein
MAWMMAVQAVRIADACDDCFDISMMTKRIRAHLFLGKLSLEMRAYKQALVSFDRAIQVILVELSVLANEQKEPHKELNVITSKNSHLLERDCLGKCTEVDGPMHR